MAALEGNAPSSDAPLETGSEYAQRRRSFYARFPHFWPDTDGREYAMLQTFALTHSEREEICRAAACLWGLYERMEPVLRSLPQEALLQLGLPAETIPAALSVVEGLSPVPIGRFDMALTPEGWKMLEFNSDTPTFYYECFEMNRLVCEELGARDINEGLSAWLGQEMGIIFLKSLAHLGWKPGDPARAVFTAFEGCEEDEGSARYLMDITVLPEEVVKEYVPVQRLRVDSENLYNPQGQRIDALYRIYPLEFLPTDRDPETGAASGLQLLDLTVRRRLALVNPPGSFLMQSKAVQAAIWGLAEAGAYFTPEECGHIRRYMLPTYLDPVFGTEKCVRKPVLGREGNTITVLEGEEEVHKSPFASYAGQQMVYQKYVEPQHITVLTEEGVRSLPAVFSCYVVNGRADGLCARLGTPIVDDNCLWLSLSL